MIDRTKFTTEELVWLEIGPNEGWGALDPKFTEALTEPIDPKTKPKKYNLRD